MNKSYLIDIEKARFNGDIEGLINKIKSKQDEDIFIRGGEAESKGRHKDSVGFLLYNHGKTLHIYDDKTMFMVNSRDYDKYFSGLVDEFIVFEDYNLEKELKTKDLEDVLEESKAYKYRLLEHLVKKGEIRAEEKIEYYDKKYNLLGDDEDDVFDAFVKNYSKKQLKELIEEYLESRYAIQ